MAKRKQQRPKKVIEQFAHEVTGISKKNIRKTSRAASSFGPKGVLVALVALVIFAAVNWDISSRVITKYTGIPFSTVSETQYGEITLTEAERANAPVVDHCQTPMVLPNYVVNISRDGMYEYYAKTDTHGRVEEVVAYQLYSKDNVPRPEGQQRICPSQQKPVGYQVGIDDAGHMIADQFDGTGTLYNLVAQERETNQRGSWKQLENTWKEQLDAGNTLTDVQIIIQYQATDVRPTGFLVSYKINGGLHQTAIANPIN